MLWKAALRSRKLCLWASFEERRMNAEIKRGSLEMAAAMLISGSIGWFVLMSGQPVINVVFWRLSLIHI